MSFADLLNRVDDAIEGMSDPRKASNATAYSLADAVLGAFTAAVWSALSR